MRTVEQFLAVWTSLAGNHDQALARCDNLIESIGDEFDSMLLTTCGVVNARGQRTDEARAALQRLENPPEATQVDPVEKAFVCATLGDLECALTSIEAAFEARSSALVFLRVAPVFDPLRDEPRFQDIVRRMNFPE